MSNTNILIKKVFIPLILLIVLVIIGFSLKGTLLNDNQSLSRISQGKAIYKEHCAACHGDNLEGQPDWKTRNAQGRLPAPPHDETGHTWHHSDQLLFELTKYGMVPPNIPEGYESDMPAYKDILSDEEIWSVLIYIKSRWPEDIANMQSKRNR